MKEKIFRKGRKTSGGHLFCADRSGAKMKKRLFSEVLALVIVISLMPINTLTVFAASGVMHSDGTVCTDPYGIYFVHTTSQWTCGWHTLTVGDVLAKGVRIGDKGGVYNTGVVKLDGNTLANGSTLPNDAKIDALDSSNGTITLSSYTCGSGVKQNGQTATCTADGYKDYYKCGSCEKLYKEAACTNEITNLSSWKTTAGQGKIAKLGHDFGYTTNGATLTASCSRKATCGQADVTLTLTASSANYSGIENLEAFNTATGKSIAESSVEIYKVDAANTTTGGEKVNGTPTEDGYYYASLTLEGVTAVKAFTIGTPGGSTVDGTVKVDEAKQEGNFEAGGLKNSVEEVKEAVLTAEEKEAVATGKNIQVWAEVKDQTATVSAEDKEKVASKLGENDVVGLYLDVTLWKQIAGSDASKVTNVPNGKVKIGFKIPADLQKEGRIYKIVRVHNGEATVLDATVDAEYNLTFETDRFSTYALIYSDPKLLPPDDDDDDDDAAPAGPVAPQTGDMTPITLYVVMMLGSIVALASVMFTGKKRRS